MKILNSVVRRASLLVIALGLCFALASCGENSGEDIEKEIYTVVCDTGYFLCENGVLRSITEEEYSAHPASESEKQRISAIYATESLASVGALIKSDMGIRLEPDDRKQYCAVVFQSTCGAVYDPDQGVAEGIYSLAYADDPNDLPEIV